MSFFVAEGSSLTRPGATIPSVVQKWHFSSRCMHIHLRNARASAPRYIASRGPLRLLVKIHLITEHYRAEGVMIAARLHVIEIARVEREEAVARVENPCADSHNG